MEPSPTSKRITVSWISKLIRARLVLTVLAFVTSTAMYVYICDVIDPQGNYDVFHDIRRVVSREEYTFFSGSEGGFYIRIGQALEKRTQEEGSIKFVNVASRGALDNARSVASKRKSFGIVQEDTITTHNFIREHLQYVSPLYLERMHIIYDSTSFERIIKARNKPAGDTASDPPSPDPMPADGAANKTKKSEVSRRLLTLTATTGNQPDDDVTYFLKNAKVSTGPVGSGSRLFAGYLLSHCGVNKPNDLGLGFGEALTRLEADTSDLEADLKVDVVFTIAGAPLDRIQKILEKSGGRRYRLMSIDPSLVPVLNSKIGLRLANASFKGKYPAGEAISTFGSWAFLIASRDVSDSVVLDTLDELNRSKGDIRREMNIDSASKFQLSEFNFYDAFISNHTGFTRVARNTLIYVAFVSVTTALIVVFLTSVVSGWMKSRYFRKMTAIYQSLPENRSLEGQSDQLEKDEKRRQDDIPKRTKKRSFPGPIIYRDQREIITKLVEGMSQLLGLSRDIRGGFDEGELSIGHYRFLVSSLEDLKLVFQNNFSQRLNEHFANYGEFQPVELRHFYTAGYLSKDGFQELSKIYGSNITEPLPAEPTVKQVAKKRVFLSYRREDSTFAVGRIRERMVNILGKDSVFQDIDIPLGSDFRHIIDREVARCDVLIAIIGSQWLSILQNRAEDINDYVRIEIESAIKHKVKIIPVLLSPATTPSEDELRESIRQISNLQNFTVRPDPEFHSSLDVLLDRITSDDGDMTTTESPKDS